MVRKQLMLSDVIKGTVVFTIARRYVGQITSLKKGSKFSTNGRTLCISVDTARLDCVACYPMIYVNEALQMHVQ